jgi:ubiquitin carboxyl-terminal hydrolase 9/24
MDYSSYKCLQRCACGLAHHLVLFQVLDVLWELAHLPTLPSSLIQQALEEHLTILSDAYAVKEAVKRSYIIKCIEDIKRVGWALL